MGIATTRPCCCIATRQNWSKRSVASWCGTRNNRLFYPKIHSTRNPTRNGTGLDSHNAPETRWRAPLGAIGPRCHHRGRTPPPAPTGSRRPPRVTPWFIEPGGYRAGSEPGRARARLRLFVHVTPHPPPLPQLRAPSPAAEERVRPPWFVKLCRSNEISLAFLKGCMEISPELLGQILHRLHSSAWNENRRPGIRIQSQVKENKSC